LVNIQIMRLWKCSYIIVIEEKQNNLSDSGVSTSPLSPVRVDNNDNDSTKTGTTITTTSSESVPSVPITPSSPAHSSPQPSIQGQEEKESQSEDNGDTTFYWDIEEAQDSNKDTEQVFDFEGNIFD
jgi:hypothetical protein